MPNSIAITGPIYATDYAEPGMCAASAVAAEIRAATGDLELSVNSPGGELEGLAEIVAALHDWRTANPTSQCTATVTALAASAAAYLLLMLPRGSRVRAYPMAMLMYHSSATLACGGSGAMRDAAHYLEQLDTVLRSYLERTAVPGSLIDEWLSEGRQGWLSASEAQDYGIVDEIVEGEAELPPMLQDNGLRAVAVFYPTNPKNEENPMAKTIKAKAVATAEEQEVEKTEVVTDDNGEKQVVETETETEVKPVEEQPVAECDPKAEEPAPEPAPDLSEIVGSLTARVEELEKMLAASQAAQAKAEASLAALSGGLRGAVTPKAEVAKPTDWRSAIKAVASAHPAMSQDDVCCEAARLYPELRAACITRINPPSFNR